MRFLCLFALSVGVSPGVPADGVLVEGGYPSYSPDGRRMAFQRETPEGMRIGVLDLQARSVAWIDGAPGHAAQPAWNAADGSLVYVYGHETRTAKEGFFAKERTGWNLRVWRDGRMSALTAGRYWDYSPSVSPDGTSVYFASTRIPVAPGLTSGTVLYRVPSVGGGLERLTDPVGNSSGLCMPSVSPDGKRLVWAALDGANDAWHLKVARADAARQSCRASAPGLVAYSPRWSPDGRFLCCTGFRAGEAGWSVYLVNPLTGRERRLFAGREPAFSPDGRKLAYVRDGTIREHDLQADDWPTGGTVPKGFSAPQEKILLTVKTPQAGDRIDMPDACAFRQDRTFFIRFRGTAPTNDIPANSAQCAFAGRYAESPLGFQIVFHHGGMCTFALRSASGEYRPIPAPVRVKKGEKVDIVGIRHDGAAYVSVNGRTPFRLEQAGTLDLKTPRHVEVMPPYRGACPTCAIDAIEVGSGWPASVPRPCTLKEVFE